jgi:murein DD-endopeptidase MepM/ murein hydrolase activator NlpD
MPTRTLRALVGVALLLSLWPAAARAQSAGPIYIVEEGDTLYEIALRFGTTVDELAEANGLADPSHLLPGMQLVLPGFPGVVGILSTRQLAFGETAPVLAQAIGSDLGGLLRLNRVVNPERVHAGQDFIVAVPADASSAEWEGGVMAARPDEGPLQTAVRMGVSPWERSTLPESSDRRWRVPDEAILFPESGRRLRAWPAPLVEIAIVPSPLRQGKTTVLDVALDDAATVEGSIDSNPLDFLSLSDRRFVALQGIRALAPMGLVEMEVRVAQAAGESEWIAFRQPILLAAVDYGQDPPLAVPRETIDPAFTEAEDAMVRRLVAPVSPDRLWDGPFAAPSDGSTTSRFGVLRNYNNTGYLYYHTGLDFSGRTGNPILAPAPGRVVFAGELQVRGNTTLIDHGWGVYTGYLHQSELLVAEGDRVETGQVIGLVGGTGRVTGPHLHWEVWVHGVPVDPMEWMETEFP